VTVADVDGGGTLQERVVANAARLSPMEQRVAEFMQVNQGRVAVSSAADLAGLIGTSDATVVRTARSLGYSNFTQLRKSVGIEAASPTAADIIEKRIGSTADSDSVLHSAVSDTVRLLGQLGDERVAENWTRAVEALGEADRVWTLGFGPAASLAEFQSLSLRRIGVESSAITMTGFRMADDLMRVGAGDVLLIFAPVRLFREIDAALAHARTVGARTIVVSEALGLAVRGRADIILSTPGTANNSASELSAGLLLAHSFVLHLAQRSHARSVTRLEELNRVRTHVVGGPLDAV
jgi:DNA-binding MurR/RpiR family transcriptional regulator